MSWTLNGTRIYVDKYSGGGKQIMPILQPLSGGSVVQFYGYETTTYKIGGLIVGTTDRDALLALKATALNTYVLMSPEGSLGTYSVKNVSFERTNIIYQTMRADLPCEAPVYTVEIELQPS